MSHFVRVFLVLLLGTALQAQLALAHTAPVISEVLYDAVGADFKVLETPTPGMVMLVPLPGSLGFLLSGVLVPGIFAQRRTSAC